ncbi:E3 SUMO-protein ligase pli1 [Tyrophagus putrescentiae]|nr:E3 SUMO-protein ligase pli1 [Tyrophagus putrescentiae]
MIQPRHILIKGHEMEHCTTHCSPQVLPNTMSQLPPRRPVWFLKLNSYDDIKTLIPPRTIYQSNTLGNSFRISDISNVLYPLNDEYKVFLRFCKPVRGQIHQLDCLPKSFNLMINQAAFQITSTRINQPARSIACDHVHCFEAKTFIKMNEITNHWTCPHCKIFIKFNDLVLDGYFMEILKSSPPNCEEAEIYPDGQYKYVLGDVSGYPAVSPSDLAPSSSCSAKRKLAENSASSHVKKQTKEVECITIDDSDDEGESGRSTNSST